MERGWKHFPQSLDDEARENHWETKELLPKKALHKYNLPTCGSDPISHMLWSKEKHFAIFKSLPWSWISTAERLYLHMKKSLTVDRITFESHFERAQMESFCSSNHWEPKSWATFNCFQSRFSIIYSKSYNAAQHRHTCTHSVTQCNSVLFWYINGINVLKRKKKMLCNWRGSYWL